MSTGTGNQIYRTIVVAWLTLSLASVILAALTWSQLSQRMARTRQDVAIREEVDTILKLLLDAETSQRGYSLTGDEMFLQPLDAAEPELARRFDRLTDLVRSEPLLLERTVNLHGQAEVLINHHRRVIKARDEEGETAAAQIVKEGEGRQIMDGVRAIVDDLLAKLDTYSNEGPDNPRAQLMRAGMTSLLAGVFGIGAGIIAFRLSILALRHQVREKELVEAKLHAERSSQEKTVFLANMSHEIRTPMNAILGFCELLQNDLPDPKHRQYLNAISTSGRSLLQLINDILDMSKIEAGVLEIKQEPTDPREICQFIKTVFVEAAARKNVKLDCLVAEDLPRSLLMDRIRLRQVLLNLVGNAVKFTDQGEVIVRLTWEKEERSHITLVMEVQDTGVGIPQDKLEQVFRPFVQAGTDREKEKQGTGLGLSIVKRMTEMMGGTVTAASIVGQGSAFSLRFPHVPISSRLASNERLESGSAADFNLLNPSRLLVVDDNEANRQLIAGMFSKSHHEVHFAQDGSQAVEKTREMSPHVILMDVRMPGMNGRETLEAIRKIPGFELTPVIAVTASSLMGEEEDLKRRFSGYVRKPFSQHELFEELTQFLPRFSPPSEASDGTPSSGTATSPAHVAPELIMELRRVTTERWLTLREDLAINECKAFAEQLVSLAADYQCPPLNHYANHLLQEAANYNVTELEGKLKEFPTVVDRLAQQIDS